MHAHRLQGMSVRQINSEHFRSATSSSRSTGRPGEHGTKSPQRRVRRGAVYRDQHLSFAFSVTNIRSVLLYGFRPSWGRRVEHSR